MNSTPSFVYDPSRKRLTIHHVNGFPDETYAYEDEAEVLEISSSHLTSLPEDLHRFKKLRVAFFYDNDFTEVPRVLSSCPQLEMVGFKSCKITHIPDDALPITLKGLILTDNKLSNLPASIGKYTHLKKLMLAGNHIQSLPEEILSCTDLELFRLSINALDASPDWIFQLPKLSWYADAGNPFHKNDRTHVQNLQEISWNDLTIGEMLGKSAKNIVYRAQFHDTEVAVKVFGGGITTDGAAIDEMHACLLAGDHSTIIGGIGKLVDAPDHAEGLVMPIVPDAFTNLGNPPDFQTFTRDVYNPQKKFTHEFIMNVLQDASSAMRHCHTKGIMHGDIYAHNILSDTYGKSFIGDFGAASLYQPASKEGKLRELVDVRGFGCLIEDLVANAIEQDNQKLRELQQSCLGPINQRPTFIEIEESLNSFS